MLETSWRRSDGASLLRRFETSLRRSNKTSWRRTTETSWRRSIETSLGVSFERYLRRCWDVQKDVTTTSPRRLNAGLGRSSHPEVFCRPTFFHRTTLVVASKHEIQAATLTAGREQEEEFRGSPDNENTNEEEENSTKQTANLQRMN